MPISSASTRIIDNPDPILENDLELLAKVNTYQQAKFDAGAQATQQEINNWSLMTNIAKPELKEYANRKLNDLVSKINNLGGVNLGDINEVNNIKAMGYNIHGDKLITDGLLTTKRMQALTADAAAKLSGKDGDKYDPIVQDYLLKGYQQWATDGDPTNSKYDGPTTLPQGNMQTINKKVSDYLKALKPDAQALPQGVADKDGNASLQYIQFEGKWLNKSRVQEAISAVTDANDQLVFRAHGVQSMANMPDEQLINRIATTYDASAANIQRQINEVTAEINQSGSDTGKKIRLENTRTELLAALGRNNDERANIVSKTSLSEGEREGIQQSLYTQAWQNNVVNANSYRQETNVLKMNPAVAFKVTEDRKAQEFAANQEYRSALLNLRQQELALKTRIAEAKAAAAGGGTGLSADGIPLTVLPNTDAESNDLVSPAKLIEKADDDYTNASTAYYGSLYNAMGANDTSGRFENRDGQWYPKPEFKDQIDSEVSLLDQKLGKWAMLTDAERKELNVPQSPEELEHTFAIRREMNTAGAFRQIAKEAEDEIFLTANNEKGVNTDFRNEEVTVISESKDASGKTIRTASTMTANEAVALARRNPDSKNMKVEFAGGQRPESLRNARGFWSNTTNQLDYRAGNYTLGDLTEEVVELKDGMEKAYQKGGRRFNSYSVPLPFEKLPKQTQEIMRKQISQKADFGTAKYESINPISGEVRINSATGQPKMLLNVEYSTGSKAQRMLIDVTADVLANPNSGYGIYFPKSDISRNYMLTLSKNGTTPFNASQGYVNALRTDVGDYPFQIARISSPVGGVEGVKVKVALPIGGGRTVEVAVKDLRPGKNGTTSFPADLDVVRQYLNGWFKDPVLKERFYREHNVDMSAPEAVETPNPSTTN